MQRSVASQDDEWQVPAAAVIGPQNPHVLGEGDDLHAEHHRPLELPIRDRFARHYADFEALYRHPSRAVALARLDLLEDVVRHKSRFFASAWTHYETARPGTFRLVPPPSRHSALARDHATMAPMFMGSPIEFDVLLRRLQAAERQLNDGSLRRLA